MTARPVKFLLCSLCIHFALYWLLWQAGVDQTGLSAHALPYATPALAVRLVPADKAAVPHSTAAVANTPLPVKSEWPMAFGQTDLLSSSAQDFVTSQEYLTAGLLTRLPIPVADIDLNMAGIEDLGVFGKLELVIRIDKAGTVVDVTPILEMENGRAFAERVAQLFKDARFTPGEIHGKPVRSQLRITVVSETLPIHGSDPLELSP